MGNDAVIYRIKMHLERIFLGKASPPLSTGSSQQLPLLTSNLKKTLSRGEELCSPRERLLLSPGPSLLPS